MELFASESNPVPADAVVGAVETPDGVRLRSALWAGTRSGAGTVCLLGGRGDTIERYFEIDRPTSGGAVSRSRSSIGGGRAAPTGGSRTGRRRTSIRSPSTTATSTRSWSRWCCRIARRHISRWRTRSAGLSRCAAAREGRGRLPPHGADRAADRVRADQPRQPTACRISAAFDGVRARRNERARRSARDDRPHPVRGQRPDRRPAGGSTATAPSLVSCPQVSVIGPDLRLAVRRLPGDARRRTIPSSPSACACRR